ncbi:MAG: glycosyltransferase family 2 protein [Candidatus Bathyarchaeia archaeon]
MHVTVLMPVYNRESFIGDALDSVVAQDYRDWDVLVVDDGSTDRTVEVVKSKMSDGRITLIQMKHGGCAAATAMGIEHARGPVITSLDSDDKLMPDALSSVMPEFDKNPRLGFIWTNWVDSTGDKGTGDFLPDGKTLIEAIISDYPRWGASAERFFKKEFYLQSEGLDTSMQYLVDVQLALLIGKTGCDTLHIPKITYWRGIHPHRISSEHFDGQMEAWRLLRRRFGRGSVALAEFYLVGLEKERDEIEQERDALRSELRGIKKCFGYKFLRFYSSIIDQTLPDGTHRGDFKRKVVDLMRGS